MRKSLVICRRELHAYFGSTLAYVLMAVFFGLTGFFFHSNVVFFNLYGQFVPPEGLWQYFFIDVRFIAMLVLPLVTMRLLAEERRTGTIELTWTYPVRDIEVVVGKFLAAAVLYLAMVGPTAIGPIVLHQYYPFAVQPVLVGYAGVVLLGFAIIACGLFVSSLTEHQVLSALITYGITVLFWFLTWNEETASHGVMQWLLGLSLFDRFFQFTRGVLETKDLVFLLLFTALFLYLTLESLATRSWRGVR